MVKCIETDCTLPSECQDFCSEHLRHRLDKWFEGMGRMPEKVDLTDEKVSLVISAVRSAYLGYTKDARNTLGSLLNLLSRTCEKCGKSIPHPAPCVSTWEGKTLHWCPGCQPEVEHGP